jgi:hypothetical protein
MTIAIKSKVRLTTDAQERCPEIGHAAGVVQDVIGGAVRVAWPAVIAWHKRADLVNVMEASR